MYCTLKQVLHNMKNAILELRHLACLPTVTMITKTGYPMRDIFELMYMCKKRYIHGIVSPVYKRIEHL